MVNYSISLAALDVLVRGLREAPDYTQRVLEAAMTEATMLLQRETQEKMPRGATGITASSITSDVFSTPAGVLGVVASSQPTAIFIELGTKPHMPPIAAMQPWVKTVLGIQDPKENRQVAFLVARKIAREGTKAQRPFGKAMEDNEAQVVRMFEEAADQIAQHLGGAA